MKLKYFYWKIVFFSIFCVQISIANPIAKDDGKLLEKSLEMQSYMNEDIDPCENFHEFSCGKWKNIHPITDDDNNIQTEYLLLVKETFDKKKLLILKDTNENNPAETELDRKVKKFFKSCIELKKGIKSEKFIDIISEFGKMPALMESDWDSSKFDWVETLAKILHKYRADIMIGVDILADIRDNSKNRVFIGEVQLDLETKSMYLEPVGETYRKVYKMSIALKLHTLLDLNLDKAVTTANEIVEFEILLAKGLSDMKGAESLNEKLLNTTIEELHQKYAPTFDVKKFFEIILGEVHNDMVYEYVPGYLLNLKQVIEQTDKHIIANYIFYNLIKLFETDTTNLDEDGLTNLCLQKVNKHFADAIDNMIYRRYDNKVTEMNLQQIWDELKALFKQKLQSNTTLAWMSYETRMAAIEKLDCMKLKINNFMDHHLDEEYRKLEINDDYVSNMRNIMALASERSIAKLHGPVATMDADETLSVTPANVHVENTVLIPVALLQPYYVWAENYPDALKFGIIGFLLAHELIHAFDEKGRQFGKHGNLKNWWDKKSEQAYEARKECFKDQYHSYLYGGKPLQRSEEQSENISDNSGLKLAFEAYMNARRKGKSNENNQQITDKMPNIEYTNEKLFFIGFAQIWCSDINEFYLSMQTEIDDHTPAKYRTIGTASNLPQFAEAFECRAGSKMNPSTKCEMY